MGKRKGLPKYRPGVSRFAVAELDSKKAHRFSIARIDGRLREGALWRVTEDIFTSQQADGIVQQLNRLELERARANNNSYIVLNVKTLRAYLCAPAAAKRLQPPDLVVD
jgi:hypothetical protein